ncbi:MAG TPA: nucleotidyltransferase family protein [Thermoanaerobaculia bacterium]|nr:nucleotidyltransferase family protein [Thermoanaerobaculia bacterium]
MESLQEAGLPALLESAARLNVESYLLDRLGASQRRLSPEAVRCLDELRRRVVSSAVDNMKRDAELSEALEGLAAQGIEAILLKGAAMRASRPGLAGRFQCDVDVLLRRRDLERAESILAGLGFRLDESYLDRENLLHSHFHLGYERRGAVVELHWDLDSSSPPGFVERLWAESREAGPDGGPFRVLAPEHQLLFGCLHLSRHGFHGGLRWLADLRLQLPAAPEVARLFEKEARDWPERAVRCPLWVLAEHGVAEAAALAGDGGADSMDRALLRRFMVPLLVAEPWLGVPAWRMEKALRSWLFSSRSLPALLAEVSGEGMSGRLRSWAVGAATDPV